MTLPWLADEMAGLCRRRVEERFPHALLLTGPAGVGKGWLAGAAARMLLCLQPGGAGACGSCRSCELLAAGTHPDLRTIEPAEGKRQIRIDQIRALSEFLMLKSQYAGYRVGIINPAEAMNLSAANSLLKTLEEPPPDAVLLLVAHQPAGLPATIRSRCQQLSVPVPPRPQAVGWLQQQDPAGAALVNLELAGGAPLRALDYGAAGVARRRDELVEQLVAVRKGAQDPVAAAAGWSGQRELLIELLIYAVADLIRRASAGDTLQGGLAGLDLMAMHRFLEKLLDARRYAEHPLNEQLVLEQLFIDWSAACRQSQ